MFNLRNVLQFVIDRLNQGPFSEQDLVGNAHQRVLHIVFNFSDKAVDKTRNEVTMRVNSKSSPNKIFKILPKFTYLNVFLGKFVYVHDNSLEILTVP